MKKQLLLSILTAGLLGGYVQAVGSKDLIDAVRSRDADSFMASFEKFIKSSEEDVLEGIERLFSSDVDLSANLHGKDAHFGTYVVPAKDMMLMLAVEGGKHNIVKSLLNKGADVNAQEPLEGNTVLILAVSNADFKIVKLLLNSGADVSIMDNDGHTVIDILEELKERVNNSDDLAAEFIFHAYGYSKRSLNNMIKLIESYKK